MSDIKKTAIEIALSEYGNSAFLGLQTNPNVLKYFTEIGAAWVKDDDTAWCAAFVNWVHKIANLPYTSNLSARALLAHGLAVQNPAVGDVVVLWRITPDSPFGHTGFFVREDDTYIWILGGNQGNKVCIAPYPKNRLLGYRHFI